MERVGKVEGGSPGKNVRTGLTAKCQATSPSLSCAAFSSVSAFGTSRSFPGTRCYLCVTSASSSYDLKTDSNIDELFETDKIRPSSGKGTKYEDSGAIRYAGIRAQLGLSE